MKHILLFCLGLYASTSLFAQERPNIIFLLSDDQSTCSMGCYGNDDVTTPHFDQLAEDGMAFDNHYNTTAICMASRANIMTGKFEYKTGTNFLHGPMHESIWQQSYPVLLKQAGYMTAFAGKFGFEVLPEGESVDPTTNADTSDATILPEGDFDIWGGSPGQSNYTTAKNQSMAKYAKDYPHSTRAYGAFGQDVIKQAKQSGKPFCLSISFKAPHRPVSPDPIDKEIYQGKTFTKPKNYGREHGQHFSLQSRQGRQYPRFHEWGYADKYDEVMALYYQQVYAIDAALGMIREELERQGLRDNTVIIFSSDNGFLCGSHGYGSKVLPYEESSRVPMIIFDPRHPNSGKQLRSEALTGNVDFAPTILALAGVSPPSSMDGKNLIKLYEDPTAEIHSSLPLINVWGPEETHSLSIVNKDWKYILWNYSKGDYQSTEELYHTAKDELELKNLVEQKPAKLKEMRALYDKQLSHWEQQAVPQNNYQPYSKIFARQ